MKQEALGYLCHRRIRSLLLASARPDTRSRPICSVSSSNTYGNSWGGSSMIQSAGMGAESSQLTAPRSIFNVTKIWRVSSLFPKEPIVLKPS